jgi:hypothetical protein
MAGKMNLNAVKPNAPAKAQGADFPRLDESNISQIEKETIDKVNKTITVLEASIATWDATKEKPDDISDKFQRYKKFHDALAGWETKALKAMGKQERFDSRVKRLEEFIDICYSYA